MDQGNVSESNASQELIDKMRVWIVRPLRSFAPIFAKPPLGMNPPQIMPTCPDPNGSLPCGSQQFYPSVGVQQASPVGQNQSLIYGFGNIRPNPVAWNSFMAPTCQPNVTDVHHQETNQASMVVDDGPSDPNSLIGQQLINGVSNPASVADVVNNPVKKRGRPPKNKVVEQQVKAYDVEPLIDSFLEPFKIKDAEAFRTSCDDREFVQSLLLVYDVIRRKIAQVEEGKHAASGVTKRPDLKVGAILMTKGVRANGKRRIGHVPGIEIGDIFFFRMELCIVGLHSPSMAGIDYMAVQVNLEEDPLAISIVSSGGYENDGDDGDVLIYSGQGGVQRKDRVMIDQKLERGNLALERSLYHGNNVRVVRGIRDTTSPTSKIYVYDGLYKIRETWAEKNKSGCSVFKYKLVRAPGQSNPFSMWKFIQMWKDGVASRPGVILLDLTAGVETEPVALVNDVDGETGPAHFRYVRSLTYNRQVLNARPFFGCNCSGGCLTGDRNCPCNRKNDFRLPYSSQRILLTTKSLIHECGMSCTCPPECRNRISQGGVRVRLEVFKTRNKGWGLRSWDPIRAGSFICEYAGDFVEAYTANCLRLETGDSYIFDATRYYEPLKVVEDDDSAGFGSGPLPYPLIINAKRNGNLARFMNHSCSPNVFWKPIMHESDNNSYLHIAFFAIRHIPPLQELTYDYGIPENSHMGKKICLCGYAKCKGYFY